MFLLIVAVVCFNFFLFRLPTLIFGANPISMMLNDELRRQLTQDVLEGMYASFGLVPNPDVFDWIYMFWRYLVSMFTGNFDLDGYLDEIAIWNRQLNDAEIQDVFSGSTTTCFDVPNFHPADLNQNGKIEIGEMLKYINRWLIDEVSDQDILDTLILWKN